MLRLYWMTATRWNCSNIVKGAFNYSGQRCTAVKKVLVMDSIADEMASKIVSEVAKLSG